MDKYNANDYRRETQKDMTYQEQHNMKQENKRLKLVIYEINIKHAQEIKRLKEEIVQPRLDITKNEQT